MTVFAFPGNEAFSTPPTEPAIPADARVSLPTHIVLRAFASETVVLNLQTGLYHSLNPVGGRILEVLGKAGTVRGAINMLLDEFEVDAEVVTRDVYRYCAELSNEGLIEIKPAR